jgi:hypothetical protein
LIDPGPGISSASDLTFSSLSFINKMGVNLTLLPTSQNIYHENRDGDLSDVYLKFPHLGDQGRSILHVNPRPAWAVQGDPISKEKNKKE